MGLMDSLISMLLELAVVLDDVLDLGCGEALEAAVVSIHPSSPETVG